MEYFLAYHSYLEAMEPLSDAERGRLFTALLEYSSTGIAPELRGGERYTFATLKGNIDRDVAKYNAKCANQSQNGKKGGRPKNPKNPSLFLKTQKSQEKEEEEDKDKDKEEDKPLRGNSARGAQEHPSVSDFGFSPDLEAAVNDWLAYKRERREAYKPVGLKSLLTQIKNAASANGDAAVAAVIRQSMSSGYKGIVFDRLERAASKPKPNSKPAMECSFAQPTGQDVERMKRLYDKLKGADDDGEF